MRLPALIPPLTSTLSIGAHGPRPAAEAWERYADPSLWSTWSPQIRRVDVGAAERITPGLQGSVYTYAPVPVHFTVEEVDEAARRWAWTVTLGPASIHLVHGVEAAALKTTTTLTMTGPTPLVYGYAPVAWLALRNLLR